MLCVAGMIVSTEQLLTPPGVPPNPALTTVDTPGDDAAANPTVVTAATAPEADAASIPAVITAATSPDADDAACNPAKTPAELAADQIPAAALQANGAVLPTDAAPEPVVPPPALGRRGQRRSGGETVAAAAATDAAFTSLTCKLDAAGYVIDVMFTRSGTTTTGCTGTTAVVTGGQNVVLDFADSHIIQVRGPPRGGATAHTVECSCALVCRRSFGRGWPLIALARPSMLRLALTPAACCTHMVLLPWCAGPAGQTDRIERSGVAGVQDRQLRHAHLRR